METKICSKCGIEKTLDNFRKSGKYYRGECKECENVRCKKYQREHKEQIKAYQKDYNKKYREEHKEEKRIKDKDYRKNNKDKIHKYNKEHKEYFKDKQREYRKKYHEKYFEYDRNYRRNNKDKVKVYQQRDYERRRNNPVLKLKDQVRNMLVNSFKKKDLRKSEKLEEIVKCDIDFLINHLYQTFKNNYGYEWDEKEPVHIDHIIPLATANNEEEVIKLCHYSNLQLLKAKDNLSKNKSLDWVLPI